MRTDDSLICWPNADGEWRVYQTSQLVGGRRVRCWREVRVGARDRDSWPSLLNWLTSNRQR